MEAFTAKIVEWLNSVFHNPNLTTTIISVIPMLETRGAITVGISMGMNPWIAYVLSCMSALIICPLLILLLKPILNALKRVKWFQKIVTAVESVFLEKAHKLENEIPESDKNNEQKRIWKMTFGIFIFVALPLPITGVWTATAIAVFIDLKYRYSVPAIVVGNFISGLIITLLNIFLAQYSVLILFVLGLFVLISLGAFVVGFIVKYKKPKAAQGTQTEKIE